MANNQYINKVIYGSDTLIDLTGDDVTAADSQTAIAELDKEYPQFRKIAEKIWKFNPESLYLH